MFNKPIYVGFTVLDLSKCMTSITTLLKKFFWCWIVIYWHRQSCLWNKSENAYEEFVKWKDLLDFSNYPKDSKFFNETNKKVIGKMKDEFGGVIVDEFVGLKSKMYFMKGIDGKECNTGKGVSIAIEFNKFKDVLKKYIRHKMKKIQSRKHKLGTYEIDKISLSCFDDKRYVLDDGIYTLAYFHKDSVTSCKKIQKDCKEIKKDCNKKDCDNWKRL